MRFAVPRRLRFSLNTLFLLSLGIAIGYAWNLWVWQVNHMLGSEAEMFRLPTYVIEPPDILRIEAVSDSTDRPPVSGEYLVAMDGHVNLGRHGRVFVAGLTIEQAENVIKTQITERRYELQVVVDVAQYNSKVYYIIVEDRARGDSVTRLPCTGNETALDAIAAADGLQSPDEKEIWIARPAPNGVGPQKIIPINYTEITRDAASRSNYQVLPGDRVFISPKQP